MRIGDLPTRTFAQTMHFKLRSLRGRFQSFCTQLTPNFLQRELESKDPSAIAEFQLPGCLTSDTHPVYQNSVAALGFQDGYQKFLAELQLAVEKDLGWSIVHFGDGDYYVLTDQPLGSAKPGRRAISRRLTLPERQRLALGLARCTLKGVDLAPTLRRHFREVLPDCEEIFPTEYIYAAVASRELTRRFGDSVGLIGAGPKLDLIRNLMAFPSYRSYLGLEQFCDYIPVKQKFAADDPDDLIRGLEPQLTHSRARLFLVGMGSAKMGVLHKLPSVKNAVYLDVGSGIDALAGVIDPRRPYFANWINFRLRNSELYEGLDLLQLDELGNFIFAETEVCFA